ncbi:hypothetical protein DHEL01_v209692 [Diaporthe helianthi]|uniref:Uncharacterized protein n=1 Tax=Diaporthe helianthi TaxID=158607 RepID=A0A2P5HNV7_DIAHE|nr:hypothetical protein DHEL01_v209692 [Diaporthe helianthi]
MASHLWLSRPWSFGRRVSGPQQAGVIARMHKKQKATMSPRDLWATESRVNPSAPATSRFAGPGKTVLVTGASSGIGRCTAWTFARGYPDHLKLVLIARRMPELIRLMDEIHARWGSRVQVCPVQLDIGDADQAQSVMTKIPQEFRDIDVLINNAGVAHGLDEVATIKDKDLEAMTFTNFLGMVKITQAVIRSILERGGRGDIVNIGSIAGREPYAGGSVYCATKAALRSFTSALRQETVATNIRVMEISPGLTRTDLPRVRFAGDEQAARHVYEGYKPLEAQDVADMILFAITRPQHVVLADVLMLCNSQRPDNNGAKSSCTGRPA